MGTERRRAERFAEDLVEVYGDRVVSVVLYGSAARGDYREGRSDLNVLVLLRRVDPEVLRLGAKRARAWVEEGNPPPLLLGEDEWATSVDAFPIEFTDIREAHRVLYGADPFESVEVDRKHLRLQCEHELRGKQVQLRERYLLSAHEPDELGELLVRALPTFLVLFRVVLRLAGEDVPREPERVVESTAALVGFDAAPMRAVLRARDAGTPLRLPMEDPTAVGYLEAVARAAEYVDRLPE